MLGKLIKHEFKATGKSFVLLFGATLALTVFSKIAMYLPFDNLIWQIIVGVAAVACVFCIFAGFIVAFVIMIYRFYNNMLKDEGYPSCLAAPSLTTRISDSYASSKIMAAFDGKTCDGSGMAAGFRGSIIFIFIYYISYGTWQ